MRLRNKQPGQLAPVELWVLFVLSVIEDAVADVIHSHTASGYPPRHCGWRLASACRDMRPTVADVVAIFFTPANRRSSGKTTYAECYLPSTDNLPTARRITAEGPQWLEPGCSRPRSPATAAWGGKRILWPTRANRSSHEPPHQFTVTGTLARGPLSRWRAPDM